MTPQRLTPEQEPGPYWLPVDLLHRVAQGQITALQAEAIRAARAQARRAQKRTSPAADGRPAPACPDCKDSGISGERPADGAPLVCTACHGPDGPKRGRQ